MQYTKQAYDRSGADRKGREQFCSITDPKAIMQTPGSISDIDQVIATEQEVVYGLAGRMIAQEKQQVYAPAFVTAIAYIYCNETGDQQVHRISYYIVHIEQNEVSVNIENNG